MDRATTRAKSIDIRAKRRNETHLEWQNRLAAMPEFEREFGEPILSPEAEQHGDYADTFVTHVETNTLAKTKRRKSTSGLIRLHENGHITAEQLAAAAEIAQVAELIERAVSVRCASLEARVDNSGGARDVLVEHLMQIRAERTYSLWRVRLPMPRRLVLDMLLVDRDLFATARVHHVGWPRARRLLVDALDRWLDLREKVWRELDERDVNAAYARLGQGRMV